MKRATLGLGLIIHYSMDASLCWRKIALLRPKEICLKAAYTLWHSLENIFKRSRSQFPSPRPAHYSQASWNIVQMSTNDYLYLQSFVSTN